MNRHALVAAAGLIALTASQASAQSYYARERISTSASSTPAPTPAPTPTPPPAPAVWTVGTWSAYSSQCSAASTSTRSVTCTRSGATVPDAQCDAGTKPTATASTAIYDGCTYAKTYGAFGSCAASSPGSTSGTQSAPLATCTRSDGTAMPVSTADCGGASVRSCTISYTATYGAFGACSGGQQTAPVATCTGSNGVSAPLSACAPKTQACQSKTHNCSMTSMSAMYGMTGTVTKAQNTNAGSYAAALAVCENAPAVTKACVIIYTGGKYSAYAYSYTSGSTGPSDAPFEIWAGYCTPA